MGEDFGEDVVGGDFAGDFAEVVHAFADVLAHEVAAEPVFKSLQTSADGFVGSCECLVVACIGHYHGFVVGHGGDGGFCHDALTQCIQVVALFG